MPEGQEPIDANNTVTNTGDLKVYSRLRLSDDWRVDTSLVCTGITTTNNVDIGTASFFVLESGNSEADYFEYERDKATRQYTAPFIYRCDMSEGYLSPYYIKITSLLDQGYEVPIFYGYIASVTCDLSSERATALALSNAGLLDQVQIFGGWYKSTDNSCRFYDDHVPVYNPNGLGNKGSATYTPDSIEVAGIDNSLLIETSTSSNKFSVKDLIDTVMGRLSGDLDADATSGQNPWSFASALYNTGDLIKFSPSVGDKLTNSVDVSDYQTQGKTVWGAFVELVEGIGGLSVTEYINLNNGINSLPYFEIVDLS